MTNPNRFTTYHIELEVITTRDATIAMAFGHLSDGEFVEKTGTSKRDPGDSHDPAVSEPLAIARALDSLSKRLKKQSAGQMKCNTDNKLNSQRASKKIDEELKSFKMAIRR